MLEVKSYRYSIKYVGYRFVFIELIVKNEYG